MKFQVVLWFVTPWSDISEDRAVFTLKIKPAWCFETSVHGTAQNTMT